MHLARNTGVYRFSALARFLIVLLVCGVASCKQDDGITRITIGPDGDQMQFDATELTFEAGTVVELTFRNDSTIPSMVHNFVLLEAGSSIEEIGAASMLAGPEAGYIPDLDAILVFTPLAEPGESKTITFTVPPPGTYPFVCLYPGHWVSMRGTLTSENRRS